MNTNFTVKHDISQSVKSIAINCTNDMLVLGAMRKILFQRIQAIIDRRNSKNKKQQLLEREMGVFGQSQIMSNLEVQQIECNPNHSNVIASVSGNSIYIWDME